jgi:hypothetical protein
MGPYQWLGDNVSSGGESQIEFLYSGKMLYKIIQILNRRPS